MYHLLRWLLRFWRFLQRVNAKYYATARFWPAWVIFLVLIFGWFFFQNNAKQGAEEKKGEPEKVWQERKFEIKENQSDLLPATESVFSQFSVFDVAIPSSSSFDFSVSSTQELKEKIQEASAEQKIFVKAGRYKLNLELTDKKLIIMGENAATILEPENPEQSLVRISGGEIQLGGMVLRDSRTGIVAENTKLKLAKLALENISATAIFVSGSELEAEKIQINACGGGIKAVSSRGRIENSVIEKNEKTGVELLTSSQFELEKNKISGNGSYGIFVDEYSMGQMTGNYVKENRGFNIRLQKEEKIFK